MTGDMRTEFTMAPWCSHCSTVVKRCHSQGHPYRGKHLRWGLLILQRLVHYHGEKHGGTQAGMVPEQELRALQYDVTSEASEKRTELDF